MKLFKLGFLAGYTKIILTGRHHKLLNSVGKLLYQPCESEKMWEYKYLNFSLYSIESCIMDCALNFSIYFCDCARPLELKYLNTGLHNKICSVELLQECFYAKMFLVSQILVFSVLFIGYVIQFKGDNNTLISCANKCRTPCDHWEFVPNSINRVTFAKKPPMYKPKENFLNDERRGNNARLYDDVAILDIAFDDLFYIEVSSKLEMLGEILNKLVF